MPSTPVRSVVSRVLDLGHANIPHCLYKNLKCLVSATTPAVQLGSVTENVDVAGNAN